MKSLRKEYVASLRAFRENSTLPVTEFLMQYSQQLDNKVTADQYFSNLICGTVPLPSPPPIFLSHFAYSVFKAKSL